MAYYTLFTREDDGKWYPQFGDYDRSTVKDEIESYRSEYMRKDIKIVSGHDNLSLNDWIALAND